MIFRNNDMDNKLIQEYIDNIAKVNYISKNVKFQEYEIPKYNFNEVKKESIFKKFINKFFKRKLD